MQRQRSRQLWRGSRRYGASKHNAEGRKLLDLCAATKAFLGNTFFQRRAAHKLSFHSSRNQEHLLDFILVGQQFLDNVCGVLCCEAPKAEATTPTAITTWCLPPSTYGSKCTSHVPQGWM